MKKTNITSRIEYLNPGGCGSTLGYSIYRRRHLSGQVDLADCNRKIEWYFYNDAESLMKIDKAIEILQAFRTDFVRARNSPPRRKPRTSLK